MQEFSTLAGDLILDERTTANGVPGMRLSVRTDQGGRVEAWQAAPGVPCGDQRFFCHGHTLGTYEKFQYTVFGSFMTTVLAQEYLKLGSLDDARKVRGHDIVVWWLGPAALHSAIVSAPACTRGTTRLDPRSTVIESKAGSSAVWTGALNRYVREYRHSASAVEVYRRRL